MPVAGVLSDYLLAERLSRRVDYRADFRWLRKMRLAWVCDRPRRAVTLALLGLFLLVAADLMRVAWGPVIATAIMHIH